MRTTAEAVGRIDNRTKRLILRRRQAWDQACEVINKLCGFDAGSWPFIKKESDRYVDVLRRAVGKQTNTALETVLGSLASLEAELAKVGIYD